jgi:hypothetical protein
MFTAHTYAIPRYNSCRFVTHFYSRLVANHTNLPQKSQVNGDLFGVLGNNSNLIYIGMLQSRTLLEKCSAVEELKKRYFLHQNHETDVVSACEIILPSFCHFIVSLEIQSHKKI